MGQYQQPWLDLKGCTLELAQRNSRASVPFMQSSLGYGLLWNNPAIGEASFAKNQTEWRARVTGEMDYWITAADTVVDITRQYVKPPELRPPPRRLSAGCGSANYATAPSRRCWRLRGSIAAVICRCR